MKYNFFVWLHFKYKCKICLTLEQCKLSLTFAVNAVCEHLFSYIELYDYW